jgi:hypothetical protein
MGGREAALVFDFGHPAVALLKFSVGAPLAVMIPSHRNAKD